MASLSNFSDPELWITFMSFILPLTSIRAATLTVPSVPRRVDPDGEHVFGIAGRIFVGTSLPAAWESEHNEYPERAIIFNKSNVRIKPHHQNYTSSIFEIPNFIHQSSSGHHSDPMCLYVSAHQGAPYDYWLFGIRIVLYRPV